MDVSELSLRQRIPIHPLHPPSPIHVRERADLFTGPSRPHHNLVSITTIRNTYATFTDPHDAEKAAGALLDHGVKSEHISIIFPEGYTSRKEDVGDAGEKLEDAATMGITTTTAADAASGSVKGATIGLAAGALAALAAVFIPGVGMVLGGGALAIALGGAAGATVAGAVAGGMTGYMKDQGVPAESIEHYNMVLSSGGAMITVSPTDEDIKALTIESLLTKYGGSISTHPLGTPALILTE